MVAELGLGLGVEVWASKKPDDLGPDPAEEEDLIEAVSGLPFVSVHTRLPFWSWDPTSLRQEVDFAVRVGASTLVVHPECLGLDPVAGGFDPPGVRRLLAYAGARGVCVALENTIDSMAKLDRAIDEFGGDLERTNLGICLDVGHAFLSSDAGRHPVHDYLERYADQLVHLHLHDTMGVRDDHLSPGRGRVPWRELLRGVEAIGYSGRAVLEVAPAGADPRAAIRQGVAFLASMESSG
jgi:sugar phosphate isomerase/epimerase